MRFRGDDDNKLPAHAAAANLLLRFFFDLRK